ncbi:hypothetical protein Tco_0756340 [Tanacetum coccineum]
MDLYHYRLIPDDLNDLIIKYKIPRDLHPRLPSEEFVMFEIPDDAIGIYYRMFDFFGVRVPFSSFLLALIKYYKSGFFLIDRRAIPDSMVWRHPSAAIDDPRPAVGSYSMADTGVEFQEESYLDVRSTLQRLPFYCTPPAAADAVISDPAPKDLAVGTPSAKVIAKAEASQKRKASTSGATSIHVAKRTRSALAQLSGSTTRPSLLVGDSDDESDGDDDACVEILLVTLIRSAAVIHSSKNQGRSSAAPATEGPDSRDKGIIVDDAVAPSAGVSRPRPSSGHVPSFRDVSGDAIHADFFPFSAGPYYATYFEGGVVESLSDDQLTTKMSMLHCMMMSHGGELFARYHGLNECHHEYLLSADSRLKGYEEKVASLTRLELQVSTLKKQVSGLNDKLSSSDASFTKPKAKRKERKKKIKSLTKSLDNLHTEVARLFAALNQATILEAKKDEEILLLKASPLEVQGELLSLAASAGFECGLSMHRTKDEFADIWKKMANFMPGAHDRLAEASPFLEPEKLVHPTNVPASRDACVSLPIAKESTLTPASKSLKLFTNVVPAPSAIASEQNEEWVNAMVDGSDPKMTDGAAPSKSRSVFVQGVSHVLDDVAEVTAVGSKRVSSGPIDVVVALSVGEKGDGSLSSFAVDEEVAANPFGV